MLEMNVNFNPDSADLDEVSNWLESTASGFCENFKSSRERDNEKIATLSVQNKSIGFLTYNTQAFLG